MLLLAIKTQLIAINANPDAIQKTPSAAFLSTNQPAITGANPLPKVNPTVTKATTEPRSAAGASLNQNDFF